jgi:hypothetical protein
MGRMSDEAPDIDEDVLTRWQSALDELEGPLTDEEAVALLSCFPTDDGSVFGRPPGPGSQRRYLHE